MRTIAALGITLPTSFITSLRTGVPGIAASIMPKIPPIDVPSQSTVAAPAAGNVGAYHAIGVGQALGEVIEVPAVAREAVDADQHARIRRIAPLRVAHDVEAVRIQAPHLPFTHFTHL